MKEKMDEARFFRNGYKVMRKAMMTKITEALEKADYNKIDLDDNHGSLCYQVIDDQESEVILSIELIKYSGGEPPNAVVVNVGVYEEENTVGIEDLSIEKLLDVMDALEKAVNEME